MSIFLQIGQCGNQLGKAVFDQLFEEVEKKTDETTQKYAEEFFYTVPNIPKPISNSIQIDMEPKVIEELYLANNKSPYIFSPNNSIIK